MKRAKSRTNFGIERRSFSLGGIEVRADGGHPRLSGHAAVFNSLSQPMSNYGETFREQIAPGAFTDSLARIASEPIVAFWNHNMDQLLGSTENGSLELAEDDRGLAVKIKPPPTTCGDDAVTLIRGGYVTKMSFGFQVAKDGQSWDIINGEDVRTIHKVRLIEVSPVVSPAYRATDIGVRSLERLAPTDLLAAASQIDPAELTAEDRDVLRRAIAALAERCGPTQQERFQMDSNRRRLRLAAA